MPCWRRRTAASAASIWWRSRSRRPWRGRKSAATSSRSSIVSTSIQTSGTATTTSARPKPRRAHDLDARVRVGQRLAHQVLAGDAEIDAAGADLAGDLGRGEEGDLDVVAPGEPAAIVALAAGCSIVRPARANRAYAPVPAAGPSRAARGCSVALRAHRACCDPVEPEREADGRDRRFGAEQRHQPVVAAAAGERREPPVGDDLEDEAGVIVERPAEAGVEADRAGGRRWRRSRRHAPKTVERGAEIERQLACAKANSAAARRQAAPDQRRNASAPERRGPAGARGSASARFSSRRAAISFGGAAAARRQPVAPIVRRHGDRRCASPAIGSGQRAIESRALRPAARSRPTAAVQPSGGAEGAAQPLLPAGGQAERVRARRRTADIAERTEASFCRAGCARSSADGVERRRSASGSAVGLRPRSSMPAWKNPLPAFAPLAEDHAEIGIALRRAARGSIWSRQTGMVNSGRSARLSPSRSRSRTCGGGGPRRPCSRNGSAGWSTGGSTTAPAGDRRRAARMRRRSGVIGRGVTVADRMSRDGAATLRRLRLGSADIPAALRGR